MKTKKLIKKLMGIGFQRNKANEFARTAKSRSLRATKMGLCKSVKTVSEYLYMVCYYDFLIGRRNKSNE